jgi:hypothetical protein
VIRGIIRVSVSSSSTERCLGLGLGVGSSYGYGGWDIGVAYCGARAERSAIDPSYAGTVTSPSDSAR